MRDKPRVVGEPSAPGNYVVRVKAPMDVDAPQAPGESYLYVDVWRLLYRIDVGLLTCNPAVTRDVVTLFHYLTRHAQAADCMTLLAATTTCGPVSSY